MRRIAYIFLSLILFGVGLQSGRAVDPRPAIAPSHETDLSGGDWRLGSFAFNEGEQRGAFRESFDDQGFRKVAVPGEVQLQLGLQGMNLYYQSKELSLANQKEWWYRKQFSVPKGDSGKLMRLVFEGVDYFASVWLNGEKLGEHEGAYVPFSFDVSSKLKYGAENLLAVKVTCPWIPKDRGFLEYLKGDWEELRPTEMRFPYPPYVLGPYWGGIPAYGNAVFPMGIFRDVKLAASGPAVVDDVFVRTKALDAQGGATLEISGVIKNFGKQDIPRAWDSRLRLPTFPVSRRRCRASR